MTNVWIQSMANMGIIPSHNWGPITFSKTDLKTPQPETERFVSWRDGFHVRDNRMGIMIECPHLLQGTEERGGRSPGMNTFVSHPGQVTIFRGFSPALMTIEW